MVGEALFQLYITVLLTKELSLLLQLLKTGSFLALVKFWLGRTPVVASARLGGILLTEELTDGSSSFELVHELFHLVYLVKELLHLVLFLFVSGWLTVHNCLASRRRKSPGHASPHTRWLAR